MGYKIVQKKNRNALYASGFWTLERAEKWLEQYNPEMWVDKAVMREDLQIVPETESEKGSAVKYNTSLYEQ